MVEKGMTVIKYLMFFFNFLFWLSGLALIIIGAIIHDKYGDYFSFADSKFASSSIFIIAVGAIVFIVGFLGCCGAIKENYCMVTTFAVLLGIIFLLEIVAGALGFAYKKKVEEAVQKALDKAVNEYNDLNEPGAKKLLDWAQQKFECCGRNGTSDYPSLQNITCVGGGVASCYSKNECDEGTLHTDGCEQGFIDFVKKNLVVVGAVALAVAFLQLLGIVFACCLMKAIKGEYEVV